MSCPAGRFSSSILAVKSLSGSAAIGGKALALPNDSVVATSTIICDGRSARAHPAVCADVTGLHAMGNLRPVGGAAEVGHRQRGEAGSCGGREKTAAGQSNGHSELLIEDLERNCLLLRKLVDAAMTGLTLESGWVEHPSD